ncbi:MAG: YhgE/Pip domain-containing protein [Bacilli bacterium]|nr:YhgE/Pip domain-containing protein [Bacilli bacterium]
MFNKIKENKMLTISILAILFIPILYAGNFIMAFKDPYNRMSEVAVAIINEDSGTTVDDEEVNIGNEFVKTLKENANFKWYFVNSDEAYQGMEDNDYYFAVKISSDFTENIYSTLNGDAKDAKLIYIANDNSNYISGVLGNALINELDNQLNQKVISLFMTTLGDNLDNVNELSSGLTELLSGSNDLMVGLENLKDGALELSEGTEEISDNLNTLASSAAQLNDGYATFNTSLEELSSSLTTVSGGYQSLSTSVSAYREALLQLLATSTLSDEQKEALLNNYDQILSSMTYLNNNLTAIDNGTSRLSTSSATIATGINGIAKGSNTLSDYLTLLSSSTNELYNGAYQLAVGSKTMHSGLELASNAISTLTSGINKIDLTTNADNLASPVVKVSESYSSVDNYGYGFAPYFISLGLFVGALVTTIVLNVKDKNKIKAKVAFKKIGIFALVVLSQALILDIILLATQISITNWLLFIAFTLLISLSFMSIIQMLSTLFGNVGRFISILLLILQLTACGGTFPIETAPNFYNVINPFMPMTYTVNGLRAIIGNGNMSIVANSSVVMIAITLVCYSIIYLYFKKEENNQ